MMTNAELLKLAQALVSAPAEVDETAWKAKLLTLLEVAVRTLDCELFAVQIIHEPPELPLEESADFPLNAALAPAAAYLAAYLAGGGSACKACYDRALEGYLSTVGAVIAPVVDRYEF